MNKEVIYLEPEDDITDILTKLQQAEQKLVALVPPKKASILRSAVNMKLVARVAKECEKVAVIVTADPAVVKMAMAAKIPVAKTLQSRPVVPTPEQVKASEAAADVITEEGDFLDEEDSKGKRGKAPAKTPSKAASAATEGPSAKSAETFDLTEESLEEGSETPKNGQNASEKSKKSAKNSKSVKVPSFDKYRKWILLGVASVAILAVVLVWAFVFAPAVTITVAISSTASNFSEGVKFTTDPAAENLAEGVFYVEKQTLEEHYTTDFTATGEEDRGNKATGTLAVSLAFSFSDATYSNGFNIDIPVGTAFMTTSGVRYVATSAAKIEWDGEFPAVCNNGTFNQINRTCIKSASVQIEAAASGEDYNIPSTTTWVAFQGATVTNTTNIAGGTTHMVKTVSQEDVDKVKDKQLEEHKNSGRDSLFEDLESDKKYVLLKDSFAAEAGELNSTPAVNDEVGENTTPNLKMTAIYSVYTIERSKVEEFIKAKTNLADDQKIYSIGDPYIERFSSIEDAARLKTTIETGPTVTEESIREKAQGRKTGEVKSLLQSINGVSSVEVRTSYFWVWTVPTDPNKVTINLTVEER